MEYRTGSRRKGELVVGELGEQEERREEGGKGWVRRNKQCDEATEMGLR